MSTFKTIRQVAALGVLPEYREHILLHGISRRKIVLYFLMKAADNLSTFPACPRRHKRYGKNLLLRMEEKDRPPFRIVRDILRSVILSIRNDVTM